MSRLGVVIKYFVKNSIDNIISIKKIKTSIVAVIICLIMFCLSLPLCYIVKYLYEPLSKYNQQNTLLLLLFCIGLLIVFLFGIYTIMNVFYFSDDIEHFLPLPVKSKEIIVAKFIAVYINMLIYSSLLITPLITYGYFSKLGATYYLLIVPVILMLPILPMVISLILCMLLMRMTIFFKNKDLLKIIAGCLSLVLVIGLNLLASGENLEESTIVNLLLKGDEGLIGKLSGIIITNKFMTYSLTNYMELKGILYLLATFVINLGLLIIYYFIGSKVYLKSIIGLVENNRSREVLIGDKKISKVHRSPRRALVFKDIKFILRTPQLFLNCIAMQLYVPISLIALLFATGQFYSLREIIENNNILSAKILIVVFVMVGLFISVGGAGTTAISRDGTDFIVYKYIPVDYRLQIKTKMVSSILINQITTLEIGILMVIFNASAKVILLSMVVAGMTTILVTLFGMFIDIKSPNLTWKDEKSLTKGNYFSLIIVIIIIFIGVLLFLLSNKIDNLGLIFFLIALVDTIISVFLYNRIMNLAEKLYME